MQIRIKARRGVMQSHLYGEFEARPLAKVLETVERAGLLHHVDKAACKVVQMHVHLTYRGNVHALRRRLNELAQGLAVD